MNLTNFLSFVSWSVKNMASLGSSPENANIIIMCQRVLSNQNMRGDYKELAHLIIMQLDGGNTLFNIQAPGALHRSRWMAKLIYSLKIILLSSKIHQELRRGAIFFRDQETKLKKFVKFIVYDYAPWWYTAIYPEDAAYNDLILWKKYITILTL